MDTRSFDGCGMGIKSLNPMGTRIQVINEDGEYTIQQIQPITIPTVGPEKKKKSILHIKYLLNSFLYYSLIYFHI